MPRIVLNEFLGQVPKVNKRRLNKRYAQRCVNVKFQDNALRPFRRPARWYPVRGTRGKFLRYVFNFANETSVYEEFPPHNYGFVYSNQEKTSADFGVENDRKPGFGSFFAFDPESASGKFEAEGVETTLERRQLWRNYDWLSFAKHTTVRKGFTQSLSREDDVTGERDPWFVYFIEDAYTGDIVQFRTHVVKFGLGDEADYVKEHTTRQFRMTFRDYSSLKRYLVATNPDEDVEDWNYAIPGPWAGFIESGSTYEKVMFNKAAITSGAALTTNRRQTGGPEDGNFYYVGDRDRALRPFGYYSLQVTRPLGCGAQKKKPEDADILVGDFSLWRSRYFRITEDNKTEGDYRDRTTSAERYRDDGVLTFYVMHGGKNLLGDSVVNRVFDRFYIGAKIRATAVEIISGEEVTQENVELTVQKIAKRGYRWGSTYVFVEMKINKDNLKSNSGGMQIDTYLSTVPWTTQNPPFWVDLTTRLDEDDDVRERTRIYTRFVCTFVDALGRESSPSVSSELVSLEATDALTLSCVPGSVSMLSAYILQPRKNFRNKLMDVLFHSAFSKGEGDLKNVYDNDIVAVRYYMLFDGVYRLLAHQDIEYGNSLVIKLPTFTFSYLSKDFELSEPVSSIFEGDICEPATDFELMPNGMMAIACGNDIYFSENYQNFKYSIFSRISLPYDVVKLGVIGSSLIAATREDVYEVIGTDPSRMSEQKLNIRQGCLSQAGAVDVGMQGLIYPSPDGLFFISSAGMSNLTAALYDRVEWLKLNPDRFHAKFHNGAYFCIRQDTVTDVDSVKGFMLIPNVQSGVGMMTEIEVPRESDSRNVRGSFVGMESDSLSDNLLLFRNASKKDLDLYYGGDFIEEELEFNRTQNINPTDEPHSIELNRIEDGIYQGYFYRDRDFHRPSFLYYRQNNIIFAGARNLNRFIINGNDDNEPRRLRYFWIRFSADWSHDQRNRVTIQAGRDAVFFDCESMEEITEFNVGYLMRRAIITYDGMNFVIGPERSSNGEDETFRCKREEPIKDDANHLDLVNHPYTEVGAWDDPDSDEVYTYKWRSKEFDMFSYFTPKYLRVDALPEEGVAYGDGNPAELTVRLIEQDDEFESGKRKRESSERIRTIAFDSPYGGVCPIPEGEKRLRYLSIEIEANVVVTNIALADDREELTMGDIGANSTGRSSAPV